jgi:hypothetical protein
MTIPAPANTTCDIYRTGRAPPASPDVAGVSCRLTGSYYLGLEHGEGDPGILKYSHVMLVDVNTDIRDGYSLGGILGGAAAPDSVYVPDKSGVLYNVIFVERRNRGTSSDHKRVYLARTQPSWPATGL